MFEAYGQCGAELARHVNRRREHPPILYTEIGFLPVFARRSKGLVTHSQLGGLRLGSCGTDRPVFVIPHAYHPRTLQFFGPRRQVQDEARTQLNLPADALILMSVGLATRAKCLDRALGALRILREAGRRCLYVIVGETQPSDYDLLGRIAHYDVGESVVLRGYAPDDEIMAYIAASDVLFNLRYPTVGETSGSLTNALAIGSCAMITDIGAYSEIPTSCAVRVPVDEMTDEGVAARLLPLVDDPDLRNFYELNSARFGRVEFDPAVFLSRYISALEQTVFTRNTFSVGERVPHWQFLSTGMSNETEHYAVESGCEANRTAQLWWREMLLPIGQSSDCLIVCGGSSFVTGMVQHAFRWKRAQIVEIESDTLIEGSTAEADVILLIIPEVEIMSRGLFPLLGINLPLRLGGVLVVNLLLEGAQSLREHFGVAVRDDNDALAHHSSERELLSLALEANGFRVDQSAEGVGGSIGGVPQRFELAARATKVSKVVVSQPASLFRRYSTRT